MILYLIFAQQKKPAIRNNQPQYQTPENPFEILGVSPTATEDEIRLAFKELTKKNHPDLVTHMASDFQKLAEEKLKKINWAYSEIRKIRKF